MEVAGLHFGVFYGLKDVARQVAGCKYLPVAALEAVIFFGGYHHSSVWTVAGDDDRLAEGHILVSPHNLTIENPRATKD